MPAIDRPHHTAAAVRALSGTDPTTTAALHSAGITEGAIRAALRAGTLERLRDGVVAVPADGPMDEYTAVRRRALAVLLRLHASAAASHETAGSVHRLPRPLPGPPASEDVIVTAARSGGHQRGLRVVSGRLAADDVTVVDGVRCTTLARTALDLALGRPLPEALVLLDAAAARAGIDEVRAACSRLGRVRGTAALSRALGLADLRAESPLESASRGVMLDSRLPLPELQQWVPDDEGRLWRVDFLWRRHRVIGEADGWVKYETLADVRAEKLREDALRRAGWVIVRWTSDELWRTPMLVVARIARALAGVR
ncbi:MAG: DUF559 domain-containing protein [Candidatus Nanopelagicales bacterium]